MRVCWFLLAVSHQLLMAASQDGLQTESALTPPKPDVQADREVWFLIQPTGPPQKFTLRCDATGNPDITYEWYKDGNPFEVDGERVIYRRPGQSGTIEFLTPQSSDKGFYQCRMSNIFGTAVSDIFDVKQGVLDHFPSRTVTEVKAIEGEPLTLRCKPPYGDPKPSLIWLIRNTKQASVIETVKKPHITVDGDGNLQFAYVDTHDGRKNLVYQCAASSPVLHGEYRIGDEIRLVVQPKGGLSIRSPKKLWTSPSHLNVTAGRQLRLTCIYSGQPVLKVHFYKENGEMPTDRLKHDDFGKTVVIDPVYATDEGTYICRVGGEVHRMHVEITAAPHWDRETPKDVTLPEDANTQLECNANGDPTPTVEWLMNGVSLNDIQPNSRRKIIADGRVLQISSLHHKVDTGVYQCNASNPFGYTFVNVYLNVLAHQPQFLTPVDQTIKAILSTKVLFDCTVKAAPLPKIRWIDEKERMIESYGRIKVLDNNSLEIVNVQMSDSGNYYCNVSNKYGLHRAVRRLRVYKPTVFTMVLSDPSEPEGSDRLIEAGEQIEFKCEAQPDERLRASLDYKWYLNEKEIDFATDKAFIRFSYPGSPDQLRLIDARGRHSGVFKCVAVTEVDEISTSMTIRVRDVPNAPIVTDIECNERRASVKWSKPFENYDNITEYIIEGRTKFHPDRWFTSLVERNSLDEKGNQVDHFDAIVTLSPWVDYTFRVTAVNSHGRGEPGMNSSPCVTPPSYPYSNPKNVRAQGDEPDNLIIFWETMEKEEWNADRFRYVVSYRKDQPDTQWENITIEDPQADRAIVRDVNTFEKYLVHVVSWNSIGRCIEEPKIVIGYSGEGVPIEAPQNFKADEILNSTSVTFTWHHVQPQSVRGHFQGYKIRIRSLTAYKKRHSESEFPEILVPAGSNSVTVSMFKAMRSYSAYVLVYNIKYEGPTSDTRTFTMPQGPPSELADMMVEAMGSTTLLVTWEPPLIINGVLKGFHIQYYKKATRNVKQAFVPDYVRHHLFTGADPASTYEVSAWAESGGGQGPFTLMTTFTYPIQPPGEPDALITVLDDTAVKVDWLPPKMGMPGSAFYVNYSVSDSDVWIQSPTFELPDNSTTINDLVGNTQYHLIVVSVDNGLETNSSVKTFRTHNSTAINEVFKAEQVANATWFIAIICALVVALVSLILICICQRNRGGKYPVKKKELERGHHLDRDEEKAFMEYQYGTDPSSDQKILK